MQLSAAFSSLLCLLCRLKPLLFQEQSPRKPTNLSVSRREAKAGSPVNGAQVNAPSSLNSSCMPSSFSFRAPSPCTHHSSDQFSFASEHVLNDKLFSDCSCSVNSWEHHRDVVQLLISNWMFYCISFIVDVNLPVSFCVRLTCGAQLLFCDSLLTHPTTLTTYPL